MKGVLTINNPYTGLLNIIQEQGKKYNPLTICIGSVENINPLTIKTGDLLLDSDNLLVSDILLGQYNRNISVDITGPTHINGSGTITLNSYLRKGDVVAMIPTENRQTYIVLCKVVKV